MDPHAVEQGQVQVHQRRVLREPQVATGLQRPAAVAGDEDRQVVVVVTIAVAVAGAVHDHAMIEQAAVALAGRLQLVEDVGGLDGPPFVVWLITRGHLKNAITGIKTT